MSITNGIIITGLYSDCNDCAFPIPDYRLVDCANGQTTMPIKWAGTTPLDPEKSYTFSFDPNTCWRAEFTITSTPSAPVYADPDIVAYDDCNACNKVCYRLIDCGPSITPDALTDDIAMQDYVGQTIKWQDDQDVIRCATVVTFLCREETFVNTDIIILSCFKTCTTCTETLGTVTEGTTPEFVAYKRKVKPNYYLATCSFKQYKFTQCEFAEAVYQKIASKRYGIEFCCEIDLDKYAVRAELMNLQILQATDFTDSTLKKCTDLRGIGNMQINNDSCNIFKVYPEI